MKKKYLWRLKLKKNELIESKLIFKHFIYDFISYLFKSLREY